MNKNKEGRLKNEFCRKFLPLQRIAPRSKTDSRVEKNVGIMKNDLHDGWHFFNGWARPMFELGKCNT